MQGDSRDPVWGSTHNLWGQSVEYRENIIRCSIFVDRHSNLVVPELKKKTHFLNKISRFMQWIYSGICKNDPRNVAENNHRQTILTTIPEYDGR